LWSSRYRRSLRIEPLWSRESASSRVA
jgi:hypothetical protein